MVLADKNSSFGRDTRPCTAHSRDRELSHKLISTAAGLGPPLFTVVPGSGLNDVSYRLDLS
jgi:hypothetical protein